MSGQHSTAKLVSNTDALCQQVDVTHHLMVNIWLAVPNMLHCVLFFFFLFLLHCQFIDYVHKYVQQVTTLPTGV
jgi:hypothetical protein